MARPAFPHLGCPNTPSSHSHTKYKRYMCVYAVEQTVDRCFRLSAEAELLVQLIRGIAGCFVACLSANWMQRQHVACVESVLVRRVCVCVSGKQREYLQHNLSSACSHTAAQGIHLESRAPTTAMCIARATPAPEWSAWKWVETCRPHSMDRESLYTSIICIQLAARLDSITRATCTAWICEPRSGRMFTYAGQRCETIPRVAIGTRLSTMASTSMCWAEAPRTLCTICNASRPTIWMPTPGITLTRCQIDKA